jgi:hypothetical protein
MQVGGRSVVLATYHNIGMLDWANLFWGWLKASNIDRFFLLELDGVTCQAARNLNCSVQFECATAAEMMLPPELSTIKQATALADWGADQHRGTTPARTHTDLLSHARARKQSPT